MDCSELSKAITTAISEIGKQQDVETLDDAIYIFNKQLGYDMSREAVVKAYDELAKSKKRAKVTLDRMKREASFDIKLRNKISELSKLSEEGGMLPERVVPTQSQTISQLQKTRDNIRKWLQNSDPKMAKRLMEKLDDINEKIKTGNIPRNLDLKLHLEVQPIADLVESAKQKLKEKKQLKDLQDKIDVLQKHLDEGTLPDVNIQNVMVSPAVQQAQEIVKDLRSKLNKSGPAKKKKLESQIAFLEEQVRTGIFDTPTLKEFEPETKEITQLLNKRDRLKMDIRRTIELQREKTTFEKVVDKANAPRVILTAYDISAPGRQGARVGLAHPILWLKEWKPMIQSLSSGEKTIAIDRSIRNDENYDLAIKSKLAIREIDGTARLTQKEEAYQSEWAEKIPGVIQSERAYLTYLNKLRMDLFNTLTYSLSTTGDVTLEQAKAISNYINVATGVGPIGNLGNAATAINAAFFSLRLESSRWAYLLGQPFYGGDNKTRKLIAKEYARSALGLMTILGLSIAAGADIEDDPRSADFMKIRVGNQSIDVTGGLMQPVVFLSRLSLSAATTIKPDIVRGEFKSTVSGRIQSIKDMTGVEVSDLLVRQVRNKLSPTVGSIFNVVFGKDVIGNPVTLKSSMKNMIMPMSMQEVSDNIKELGIPEGIAMSMVSLSGFSIQTYDRYSDNHKAVWQEFDLWNWERKIANEQDLNLEPVHEWRYQFLKDKTNVLNEYNTMSRMVSGDIDQKQLDKKLNELSKKTDQRYKKIANIVRSNISDPEKIKKELDKGIETIANQYIKMEDMPYGKYAYGIPSKSYDELSEKQREDLRYRVAVLKSSGVNIKDVVNKLYEYSDQRNGEREVSDSIFEKKLENLEIYWNKDISK